MAEHSYEIVVKLEGAGGGSGSSGSFAIKNPADKITSTPVSSTSDFVKKTVVVKELTGLPKKAVSFTVSNVALTTGNSESQQKAEFMLNTMGATTNALIALSTGNYLGLALMTMNALTSLYFNQKQIEKEQLIETESLNLSRQRAGIAFNRSRMGGAG